MGSSSGSAPQVDVYIGDSTDNLRPNVERFEWKSMLNGGFIIRAKILDPYDKRLGDIISGVLKKARRDPMYPVPIKFRIRWNNGDSTPWRVAAMSNLYGVQYGGRSGSFEFIAIDPVSWYLNWGDASGGLFKGRIGGSDGVIMKCLNKYLPEDFYGFKIVKEVDDTIEAESQYWEMRQDPKTFIMSLLDWSSSLTKNRTNWIVSSGQTLGTQQGDADTPPPYGGEIKISIKEGFSNKLQPPAASSPLPNATGGGKGGPLSFKMPIDTIGSQVLFDSMLVTSAAKLTTGGISTVSGEYLDMYIDEKQENVWVHDGNTDKKMNVRIESNQGFDTPALHIATPSGYSNDAAKSENRGFTTIKSVPEFSGGDLGMPYKLFMDGRARQTYINLLDMVMRMRVDVRGEPRLHDSNDLGRSFIRLDWKDQDGEDQVFHGPWMLFGWHHVLIAGMVPGWKTNMFIYRLDHDAQAQKGE